MIETGEHSLHFYTMNLASTVTKILQGLNLIPKDSYHNSTAPPKTSIIGKRPDEEIRPIFWSNRQCSYLARTQTWDDFPVREGVNAYDDTIKIRMNVPWNRMVDGETVEVLLMVN